MADLTIHGIDEKLEQRLRDEAARHGRSVEDEAREIISKALPARPHRSGKELYEAIRARVEPFGGFELELPPRKPIREPPSFEE